MYSPRYSIRLKLLGGFVGLVLLILLGVLFTVSQILDNRIREDINANFQEAGMIFDQLQDVRFRQLLQTATLVAEMPYLKASISTGDQTTVNNQIREDIVQLLDFSPLITDALNSIQLEGGSYMPGVMMVFDEEGVVLGQLSDTVSNEEPASLTPAVSGLGSTELSQREGYLSGSIAHELAGVRAALEGERPDKSYIWYQNGNYFNVITIPVTLGEVLIGAISLGYPIRNFEAELLAQLIGYEVSYFMDGNLLATSIDSLTERGIEELSRNIENTVFNGDQIRHGRTVEMELDGNPWLVYVLPMGEAVGAGNGIAGYYTVAQSLPAVLAPLYELQRVIYLIGLGGIFIAILIGVSLTTTITRPINRLLEGIKRIENNDYDRPVDVVSRDEFGQLTQTFNTLVAHIRENLQEKETLMAEIHHRVKNNLAVISGLLELEGDTATDSNTKRALQNSRLRIQSMATVHELLYEAKNFSKLSFDTFVSKMVSSIKNVYSSDRTAIEVETDLQSVRLNVNQAVPCGIIINELLTNAVKHAYSEGSAGIIRVSLSEENGMISLKVRDNGIGLPEDFNLEKSESLGFTLINILSKQLHARVLIDTQSGTEITILFSRVDKRGSSSTLDTQLMK